MSGAAQRRIALVRGLLAAALLAPCLIPVAARADGSDPAAPVAALDAALLAAMKAGKQAGFAGREHILAPAIDSAFDLPGILKGVVGPRWSNIPAAQQQSLLTSFRNFTLASYAGNFDSFDGQTISVVPPPRAVGADQVVQTTIVSSSDTNRIDYQMRQVDGAWKAVDVLLDGSISNVAVQRSDFRTLLAGGSAQPLIDSLDQRSAKLANGESQ